MPTHTVDDITITVYRYGFRPGFYAEAKDASGRRVAFTGVFTGKGSRQKAIDAALASAKAGRAAANDIGCIG